MKINKTLYSYRFLKRTINQKKGTWCDSNDSNKWQSYLGIFTWLRQNRFKANHSWRQIVNAIISVSIKTIPQLKIHTKIVRRALKITSNNSLLGTTLPLTITHDTIVHTS